MIQPFSPLPRPGSFLPFLISGQCIAQLVSILYLFAFSVEIGHVTLPLLLSLSLSLFLSLSPSPPAAADWPAPIIDDDAIDVADDRYSSAGSVHSIAFNWNWIPQPGLSAGSDGLNRSIKFDSMAAGRRIGHHSMPRGRFNKVHATELMSRVQFS